MTLLAKNGPDRTSICAVSSCWIGLQYDELLFRFKVGCLMSESSYPTLGLLQQARDGDGSSLGVLLRKYFRYLNSLSHGHLDERIGIRVSASDIVQETLLEAHRDFSKFSGTSIEEFTGWLRRILFNNLATAIEKHVLADKRDVRKQLSLDQTIGNTDHSKAKLARYLQQDITSPSAPMQRDESLRQLSTTQLYRALIVAHDSGMSFDIPGSQEAI